MALFVALGGGAYAMTALPPNSVGPAQLQADSVKSRALANNSVDSSEIQKQAVQLSDMAQNSVGPGQLKAFAVQQSDLASNAVTQSKLAQDSVGSAQIRLASIDAQQIKDHTLAPQEFTANGLPEVGYSSRELGNSSGPPYGPSEVLTTSATNAGVLNLDIPASGDSGYTTSSGVVGAVAPSRLTANAQVVVHAFVNTMVYCRLARFHAGFTDQLPFAAGTNTNVDAGKEAAIPLAGRLDVDPGSYHVRVQCYVP